MSFCYRLLALVALAPLGAAGCNDSQPEGRSPPAAPRAAEATALAAKAEPAPDPAPRTLVVSGIGDCTLASEFHSADAPGSFPDELKRHDDGFAYPFAGVKDVLSRDDLTIANLETTLTDATSPSGDGAYHFRGKPEYTAILAAGSVEVVNVANNHSRDFGEKGYVETAAVLRAAGIGVGGNAFVDKRVVKGVEIVNLGFTGGDPAVMPRVRRKVAEHKTEKNLVIVSFHWGAEGTNDVGDVQRRLGHAAVESGADLVLGTHPHVLQGIEEYKGRHIVYSLGNFVFGGNSNPKDKDSIIYQETFAERDGKMVPTVSSVIPVRISSVTTRNDYHPVVLEGADRERVLERVQRYSDALARPRTVAKR